MSIISKLQVKFMIFDILTKTHEIIRITIYVYKLYLKRKKLPYTRDMHCKHQYLAMLRL